MKTSLWWNNGTTKHVPFALRQLVWQKPVRHKDGLQKLFSTRNHFFYLQDIRAGQRAVLLIRSIFNLVRNYSKLGGNDTTWETGKPVMYCRWPVSCMVFSSIEIPLPVLHLKCFSFSIVACPALDGMCPGRIFVGGGWMMVRSLQFRNAYLPRVVDDGQFSSIFILVSNILRVVPNVLSCYPKGSPQCPIIQPLYTLYLSFDHWQQTLQWCLDVGYPITAVVERQSLHPMGFVSHETKGCNSK